MVSEQSQAGNDRLMQTTPQGGGSGSSDLGTTAKETAQDLKGTAQDVMQQTKDTAGQVVDQAKEQAVSRMDDRKDQMVQSFGSVADALRQASKHLKENEQSPIAQYADKAADRVEQWAENLRGKDVQEIMRDVEDYARRQPALFLGGAFVVGLLAARFLKSTAHRDEAENGGYQSSRGYRGYTSGYGAGGYGAYRGSTYRGSRGYGSMYGTGRSGYSGGSYETSGRADYYGGDPAAMRGRGYAAGTTDYGADRTRCGVDEGRYRGGMGESTDATGSTTGMTGSTGEYGTAGERSWYVRGRETQ
jgi:ElaB/YqjD/DUF883 family membrane-anchored ribosome-binding protein